MAEIIENAFQMAVVAICLAVTVIEVLRTKRRAWIILMLFYSELFIGNLYWQLYMAFYGDYPLFPFASELCWDVAFGFLLLLARSFSRGRIGIKKDPILLLIPVFTGGWAIYYMNWGQIADNIVCAVLMGALIMRSVYSINSMKGKYTGAERVNPSTRKLFVAILLFCTAEYLSWTASCLFDGNTFANPYIWMDFLVTVACTFFIPAVKACDIEAYASLPGED